MGWLTAVLEVVLLSAVWSVSTALGTDEDSDDEKEEEQTVGRQWNWTVGLFAAYEYRSFDEIEFEHETHPDDALFMTGSPGSTEIDDGHFLSLGLRGELRNLFELPLEVSADGGLLLFGARDEHQNDNDTRPPEDGSFVYSNTEIGGEAAVGAQYRLFGDRFGVGGEANWAWLLVDHGWDRYARDESADDETLFLFNAGPKVSYRAWDCATLEASYLFGFGKNSEQMVAVGLVFTWPR